MTLSLNTTQTDIAVRFLLDFLPVVEISRHTEKQKYLGDIHTLKIKKIITKVIVFVDASVMSHKINFNI